MRLRSALLPALAVSALLAPLLLETGPAGAAAGAATGPRFVAPVALNDASGASTLGAEPSIEVDSKGQVYVSAPAGVPTGGCPFWNVHPDTRNAKGLPYDYRGTIDTDHGSIGGGDCDVSITPQPGAAYDQVSVTSLSLANLTSNTTKDGGKTFTTVANPASQQVFGVDRQWQASDPGLGRHYLSVHDLATTNIQVSVSTDGGYQYVQNTPAINPQQAPGAVGLGGNHFGTTVVDPVTHKLYIPFLAPGPDEPSGGNEHAVWVAEGDPCATVACTPGAPAGPISWTDHLVYSAPASVKLSHIFPAIAIDRAGTVYVAWTGDTTKAADSSPGDQAANHIFVTHSRPRVVTAGSWTTPRAIDGGVAHSNMFPWLIAGERGQVAAVWYSGRLAGDAACGARSGTATDDDGVNNNCRNAWRVVYAQTRNGDTARPSWSHSPASPVVHHGSVCDSGTACLTFGGDRTLLDFFDVALDQLGRPNIAYVSDVRAPGTADVQYTRQCAGTTLTGVTLPAKCGPLGAKPAACTADAAYTDASGDANAVLGNSTPLPSDPALDVVGGSLATTAEGVALTTRLLDLEPGTYGQIVEQHFTIGGQGYYVMASRDTGTSATSYDYGTSDATTFRGKLGSTTGSFDDAGNTVSIVLPRTLSPTASLHAGDVLSGLVTTTRRDGVLLIPDADTAVDPCGYTVAS